MYDCDIYFPLAATSVLLLQTNIDKDQVKAAIKAQQDQQIDNVSTVMVKVTPKLLVNLVDNILFLCIKLLITLIPKLVDHFS